MVHVVILCKVRPTSRDEDTRATTELCPQEESLCAVRVDRTGKQQYTVTTNRGSVKIRTDGIMPTCILLSHKLQIYKKINKAKYTIINHIV